MNQELIWKALSDPTRRSIMDALRESPRTTGDLSKVYSNLSRFAVMKHLGVLEKADLIFIKREGKFRWNYINPIPLQQVYERWVKKYEKQWAGNLLSLKEFTEQNTNMMNTQESTLSATKVAIEIAIKAPIEVVWQAVTSEANAWWRKDFYTSPKTKQFIIEKKLGGKMYEDYGNGEGLVWAEVIGINSPQSIEFKGNLSASFGGPAISFLKIELASNGEETKLTLTDDIFGKVGENVKTSMTKGWELLFGHGLKPYVENRLSQV